MKPVRRLCLLLLIFCLWAGAPLVAQTRAQTLRIGVLGIFHPRQLTLAADPNEELLVAASGQQIFLRSGSPCGLLHIRPLGSGLLLSCGGKEIRATEMRVSGRNQQSTGIVLAVPGKIKRRYQGVLELEAKGNELIPVVIMELETAVASVVQAETIPGTPLEALKAQAVVDRSYFVAGGGRHKDFDFCDLTHCQFLREPAAADSPAALAAAATEGLVLTYEGKPIVAMFTRSCGGHTRTPREVGLPEGSYPFFSALCDSCYKDPFRWTRKVSREDAALLILRGENGRLAIGRRLGWNTVPSNNFASRKEGDEVVLEGVGQGHGLGLCQRGARDMAEHGSNFQAILEHYFPNTRLQGLPSAVRGHSSRSAKDQP